MPKKKNTQEAAKEAVEEARKSVKKGFVVRAPFDEYKKGDSFVAPDGWERDDSFLELVINKRQTRDGIAFRKADGKNVILPLEEK